MRINPKYLIRYVSKHSKEKMDEYGDIVINQTLRGLADVMQEGVNYSMEITPTTPTSWDERWLGKDGQCQLDISCVVLTPEVFRKMVEKIDYHDPYYMDLIFPELSTIEP